ncbi:MAG TPA: DUF4097 family beta strand repeat protein [Candidatus Avipropionibacterium avicola]|uniref:DUF4097 family beta strand repeat protein n=1 Tax=Candidatus Avipropionibacterium avicola TaxID=2840701 RepID=A0A9D1GXR6_9ACTN|nr:DUF4097 family beta strand repeat protein [Candidatus Avipropionibacterium avicola]
MASHPSPSEAQREDEFPLYDPGPAGPGAPVDNPAPDASVVANPTDQSSSSTDNSSTVNRRALLALGGGAVFGVIGITRLARRGGGNPNGTFALQPDVIDFVVETSSGDVTVRGTTGTPMASWRGGPRNRDPQLSENATTTSISGSSADLTLDVPVGATVTVSTKSGDVRIENVELENLTVETTSGDVQVTDAATGDTSVTTTSGEIDLNLSEQPTAVSVNTTSGDVDLQLPDRGYRYEIDTRSGDVNIPDNSGDVPVSIRTTSGDIDIAEEN